MHACRTNLAFAALTMNEDLHFTASEYGIASGVFFLSYAIFQATPWLLSLLSALHAGDEACAADWMVWVLGAEQHCAVSHSRWRQGVACHPHHIVGHCCNIVCGTEGVDTFSGAQRCCCSGMNCVSKSR